MEGCEMLMKVLSFLVTFATISSGKLSSQECRQLGFSSNLLCGSCNELKQFKLDKLVSSCQSCCEKDRTENEGKRYMAATLKYVRGLDPVLMLHDEHHNVKDELSIDKWDTDTIEEFLKEKLMM
eukprot:gene16167-17789_t